MKKSLFIFGVIAAALLLVGAGCAKKGAVTPAPEGAGAPTGGAPAAEETVPAAKDGDIGKMTDDLYVEITAQLNYQGAKDPDGWLLGGGYERWLKSIGVTDAQLEAYGRKLESDPGRISELGQRALKRMEELEKQEN